MADTVISIAAAIAACDAIVDLVDGGAAAGYVRIYDDTAPGKPADVSVAVTTQVVLAELTFSDPAFLGASDQNPNARAAADTITSDSSADASGTATWFRVFDSNNLAIWDGDITTVAAGTGDMLMNSTSISAGAAVSISSWFFTMPEQA